MSNIDPTTGRVLGDHGAATDAIEYAVDHCNGEGIEFLRAWRMGNTASEWPEFYLWLKKEGR